jgi:hypothetical protein
LAGAAALAAVGSYGRPIAHALGSPAQIATSRL